MFVTISKDNSRKLTANFRNKEFFTSSDVPSDFSHEIDFRLVEAAQAIRDYINAPVRITSSYRTPEHQISLAAKGIGSRVSQHIYGRAIDLQPVDWPDITFWIPELTKQLSDPTSFLFMKLRQIGIVGFGLYDTFIHLDTRTSRGKRKDDYGSYAYWDFRKKKADH